MSVEALWRRFRSALHRFLRSRLPTDQDADDVLQEVFLRIQEQGTQLEHPDRVQAWVYSIARRTVADFYRQRARRATVLSAAPQDEPQEGAIPTVPEATDNLSPYAGTHDVHEEVLSWLRPFIDALPERYRVPLHMADIEGRTQQEVADALGLSLSGAKSRVQRARQQVGELLARCCDVEFGSEGRAVAFRRLHPRPDPCADGCAGG